MINDARDAAWELAEQLHDDLVNAHALDWCAHAAFANAQKQLDTAERAVVAAVKRAERARAQLHRAASLCEDTSRLIARAIDAERSACLTM